MNRVGVTGPPWLSRREQFGWVWWTAVTWAAGSGGLWTLAALNWKDPGSISMAALVLVVSAGGGLLVGGVQAWFVRRWRWAAWGWLAVTWLGVTLASVSRASIMGLATPGDVGLGMCLAGAAVGWVGQWVILRRLGFPSRTGLLALAAGWWGAVALSSVISLILYFMQLEVAPPWTVQELVVKTASSYALTELVVPGLVFGLGSGWALGAPSGSGLEAGVEGREEGGEAEGGARRRVVRRLAVVVAGVAILALAGRLLGVLGAETDFKRIEGPYGVSFAYPPKWEARYEEEWLALSDPNRPFILPVGLFRILGPEEETGLDPQRVAQMGLENVYWGRNIPRQVLREGPLSVQGEVGYEAEYLVQDLRYRVRVVAFPADGGRAVGLLILQAPEEVYAAYEEVFDALVNSIELRRGASP